MAETTRTKLLNIIKNKNQSAIPARRVILHESNACPKCVSWSPEAQASQEESIMEFQAYDDLCIRPQLKPGAYKYQTAQYHPGQIDSLKLSVRMRPDVPTVILVNAHLNHDLTLMDQVMQSRGLPKTYWYIRAHKTNKNLSHAIKQHGMVAIPVKIFDCCVEDEFWYDRKDDDCWELKELPQLFKETMEALRIDKNSDLRIVQAVINKDHDVVYNWSVGTICLQMMQPFYMTQFNPQVPNNLPQPVEVALALHFAADTASNSPILAPSVMAFILCYMDKVGPINFLELEDVFQWFCKSAISNNVQLAFSGKSEFIREYCFLILEEYIKVDRSNQQVSPIKMDLLKYQAEVVVPKMARIGIIAYAILLAYNTRTAIHESKLKANMRVSKKKVLNHARKALTLLQTRMPFKKPCEDDDEYLFSSFNTMGQFYGYFSVTDPISLRKDKSGYLGDYDSDSDYPLDLDEDPMYEPWIRLTPRQYRIDRLNLCLNAIHEYARESVAKNPLGNNLPSAPSPTEMNRRFV